MQDTDVGETKPTMIDDELQEDDFTSDSKTKAPQEQKYKQIGQGKTVVNSAGWFSRFWFNWGFPFVKGATKEQLHISQYGNLHDSDNVEPDLERMIIYWDRYRKQENTKNSLFKTVFRTFSTAFSIQIFLSFIVAAFQFASPFLIIRLVNFIEATDNPPIMNGVYLVIGLVLTQLISLFIYEHLLYYQVMTGVKATNILISFVYKKHLNISSATNKDFTMGEIVNFVQVDAEMLFWLCFQMTRISQVPFVFILCFYLLFTYLGLSFFSGIGILVFAFLVNGGIAFYFQKIFKKVMATKDARMKVTSESMNNIKTLKLYSWQDKFLEKIKDRRAEEVAILRGAGCAIATIVTSLYFFPQILSGVVFTTYIGTGHTLSLSDAITVLVIFDLIRAPLRAVPMFLADISQLVVSLRRIQAFLNCNEIQKDLIRKNTHKSENAIEVDKSKFSWGFQESKEEKKKKGKKPETKKKKDKKGKLTESEPLLDAEPEVKKTISDYVSLKDIEFNIKKGEFVCIIGDVSSGKSSLLSALIGDLIYISEPELAQMGGLTQTIDDENSKEYANMLLGETHVVQQPPIRIDGKISFVEQNPWIQNQTIRDNILFGKPLDDAEYVDTIIACELERDLLILPAGDQTEIGEKGINLSGGQKARVSLARAVYSNKDIVLMDDPISALDANVRKNIFQNVFQGKLKDKTRVLVTHAIDFLHLADRIFVMQKGNITAMGTFNQLQDNEHLKEVLDIHKKNTKQSRGQTDQDEEKQPDLINQMEELKKDTEEETRNKSELIPSQQDQSFASQNLNESRKSNIDNKNVNNMGLQNQSVLTSNLSETITDQVRQTYKSDFGGNTIEEVNQEDSFEHSKETKNFMNEKRTPQEIKEKMLRYAAVNQVDKEISKILLDETKEIINVSSETYSTLLKMVGGPTPLIFINFVMIGFMLSKIYCDFLTATWAKSPADEQREELSYYSPMIIGMATITSLCVFIRVVSLLIMSLKVAKTLHNDIVTKVLQAPINLFFDVTPVGKILNLLTKDLAIMDINLCMSVGDFLGTCYLALASLLVATLAVPWILIAIILLMFIGACLFRFVLRAYKDSYRIEAITKSPLLSFMQESFRGCSVIRAFEQQDAFQNRGYELVDKNTLANQVSQGIWGWYSIRMDMISVTVLAVAGAGAIGFRHVTDPALLGLLLQYSLSLQSYVSYVLFAYGEIERQMVSVQRLFQLKKVPQEKSDGLTEEQLSHQTKGEWPYQGKITFNNVSLKYRPKTEIVLKDLSFNVQPGEKIGVVGRTGAGKSTICLSMSRIMELHQGQILIDDVNINEVELELLRRRVTVIPQDPTLFTGTLRFNLDPFNSTSDERIESLLKAAGLEDLLTRDQGSKKEDDESKENSSGINMQIQEAGVNLSSGEKQLICICRAILRKNKVVILDEATANIDIVTEKKIQKLINEEFTDSTVITIAHRLNTIMASDKVLVLSYGQVKEYDSPANLQADRNSEFSKLLTELKKKEKENNQ